MNELSLLYLGKERTLFLGYLDHPLFLSQGAATLSISLGDPINIELPDKGISFSGTSVLAPPGFSVHMDSVGQKVANINLDVMGSDFYFLAKNMTKQHGLYTNLNFEHEFKQTLQQIYDSQLEINDVKSHLKSLLTLKEGDCFHREERVQSVVDIIQNTIEQNLSIEYLADKVNLSVSGLTKIFKKQTGVPIRRYRQWHRLFITATEIGRGKSLTDAAMIAGFVDLPHCTHTFNQMLGMKPSYFLLRPDEIKIMVEGAG